VRKTIICHQNFIALLTFWIDTLASWVVPSFPPSACSPEDVPTGKFKRLSQRRSAIQPLHAALLRRRQPFKIGRQVIRVVRSSILGFRFERPHEHFGDAGLLSNLAGGQSGRCPQEGVPRPGQRDRAPCRQCRPARADRQGKALQDRPLRALPGLSTSRANVQAGGSGHCRSGASRLRRSLLMRHPDLASPQLSGPSSFPWVTSESGSGHHVGLDGPKQGTLERIRRLCKCRRYRANPSRIAHLHVSRRSGRRWESGNYPGCPKWGEGVYSPGQGRAPI
jgi:hypothetical protein